MNHLDSATPSKQRNGQAGPPNRDFETPHAYHSLIRAGRPQTNGAVEALHRLILEECWRPAFARYLHVRFSGLKRDLAQYLSDYNFDHVHNGRLTRGRNPGGHRLPCRQGEDEMSRNCRHISVTASLVALWAWPEASAWRRRGPGGRARG